MAGKLIWMEFTVLLLLRKHCSNGTEDASVSAINCCSKSGNSNTGALVSFIFNWSEACCVRSLLHTVLPVEVCDPLRGRIEYCRYLRRVFYESLVIVRKP